MLSIGFSFIFNFSVSSLWVIIYAASLCVIILEEPSYRYWGLTETMGSRCPCTCNPFAETSIRHPLELAGAAYSYSPEQAPKFNIRRLRSLMCTVSSEPSILDDTEHAKSRNAALDGILMRGTS